MSVILNDRCLDSKEYLKEITGFSFCEEISLEKCEKILEERNMCLWNYPLTEIEHIIENDIDVVLVRFPKINGEYEYRLCEY